MWACSTTVHFYVYISIYRRTDTQGERVTCIDIHTYIYIYMCIYIYIYTYSFTERTRFEGPPGVVLLSSAGDALQRSQEWRKAL